jgi:hypothetical protein
VCYKPVSVSNTPPAHGCFLCPCLPDFLLPPPGDLSPAPCCLLDFRNTTLLADLGDLAGELPVPPQGKRIMRFWLQQTRSGKQLVRADSSMRVTCCPLYFGYPPCKTHTHTMYTHAYVRTRTHAHTYIRTLHTCKCAQQHMQPHTYTFWPPLLSMMRPTGLC